MGKKTKSFYLVFLMLVLSFSSGIPHFAPTAPGEGLPEVGDGAGAAHLAERAVVHATADDLLANLRSRSRIVAEKRGTTRAGWTHPGCGRRG